MKKYLIFTFLTILFAGAGVSVSAQCKGFAKKQCYPKLAPFTHNGRLYSAVMEKGQVSQIHVTFNGGMKYRVLNCVPKDDGKSAQFKLLDKKGRVLFDNTQHDLTQQRDFQVEATQDFMIEVLVPKKKKLDLGTVCSVVLIGFQEN